MLVSWCAVLFLIKGGGRSKIILAPFRCIFHMFHGAHHSLCPHRPKDALTALRAWEPASLALEASLVSEDCLLCLDTCARSSGLACPSGHFFCGGCMDDYVRHSAADAVLFGRAGQRQDQSGGCCCPQRSCSERIPHKQVQFLSANECPPPLPSTHLPHNFSWMSYVVIDTSYMSYIVYVVHCILYVYAVICM